MYGAGLMWNHRNKLKLGVDYSLQKWASVVSPVYDTSGATPQYVALKNQFNDRHKITFGGEFCPLENSRNFFKRIHYRMGASYASSYLKINGADGPKEYSVSAGFGIPIVNSYNNRSSSTSLVSGYVRIRKCLLKKIHFELISASLSTRDGLLSGRLNNDCENET